MICVTCLETLSSAPTWTLIKPAAK
jgi:hypothetical protein